MINKFMINFDQHSIQLLFVTVSYSFATQKSRDLTKP